MHPLYIFKHEHGKNETSRWLPHMLMYQALETILSW